MPLSLQAETGTNLSLCSNLVVSFKEDNKHMDNKNLAKRDYTDFQTRMSINK